MVDVIMKGDMNKGKRVRHYEIKEVDMQKLLKGESIFFYEGHEIDIHFKLRKDLLEKMVKKDDD